MSLLRTEQLSNTRHFSSVFLNAIPLILLEIGLRISLGRVGKHVAARVEKELALSSSQV